MTSDAHRPAPAGGPALLIGGDSIRDKSTAANPEPAHYCTACDALADVVVGLRVRCRALEMALAAMRDAEVER